MQLYDGIATVRHAHLILRPDVTRVLFRPFHPDSLRELKIVARVTSLSEEQAARRLADLLEDLEGDGQAKGYFFDQFEAVKDNILTDEALSDTRKLLIGAYFTQQYAFESAALFNPSMVPHLDQSDLPEGSLRFIMSLRATGEGHLSSITFRSGVVDAEGNIEIEPATRFVTAPKLIPMAAYDKGLFQRKLQEIGCDTELGNSILERLDDSFSFDDLCSSIDVVSRRLGITSSDNHPDLRAMLLLARSNYSVGFSPGQSLSARVIFPQGPTEIAGIEDARFVLFHEDDEPPVYYATYTAYDGRVAIPQLLETQDFLSFHMSTLNGPAIANKGVALFPRRINGHFAMLSRQDNENIHLMFSDSLHFWYKSQLLLKPTYPWEFVQLGNCGSPIETEAGWLVLSHGVGALRKYSIGAFLLDRDDPSKVIGRLRHPLLTPNEAERAGYVPNVVYSCGALVHNGILVLPYAMSDSASTFATVRLDDLLNAMKFHL